MAGIAQRLNARLEQSVLDESSAVVTISPAMQRAFVAKTSTPCTTIFNGFDIEDFESGTVDSSSSEKASFTISHVGNMNPARNPEVLWHALKKACAQERFPDLKIRLVGNVDAAVSASIRENNLTELVEHIGYCSHNDAVNYMKASSALLLPINRVSSAKGIVTGKLFEYLASKNPVIGIGPVDGDAAAILDEVSAGIMFDYEDEKGLLNHLAELYDNWQKNAPIPEKEGLGIEKYSRRGQTGELANLMKGLLEDRT